MKRSHLGRGAQQVSLSLIIGAGMLLPTLAHAASVTTALGSLLGDVALTASTQVGNKVSNISVPVDQLGLQTDAQGIHLSFNPHVSDLYSGGFSSNGYTHSGSISLVGLPELVPASGAALGDVQVTVSGSYVMTGSSFLYFNNFDNLNHGTGSFAFTSSLADLANRQNVLVSWFGAHPYVQGSDGTASVFSTLQVDVTQVTVHYGVAAVPEPGSLALMGLGLVGLTLAARRRAH